MKALVAAALAVAVGLGQGGYKAMASLSGFRQPVALDTLAQAFEMRAAPADVYAALVMAFKGLGITTTIDDPQKRVIANTRLSRNRTFIRERLSQFFDCGSGMTGPHADEWRVELAVAAIVNPGASGGSRLLVATLASAQDNAGSSGAAPCSSKGELEARIHAAVVKMMTGGQDSGASDEPMPAQPAAGRWYKGNTHAHTLNSDGDSPPDAVVRWYRTHGYQFTFITDHEYVTDVAPLNALFGAAGKFLVISGQEVTQRVSDSGRDDGVRQAHVNALGVTRVIRPLGERNIAQQSIGATYARNLAEIRRAGGVPQVNHPNFRWSVPLAELVDLPDSTSFEVWNGHPDVHNLGGTDTSGRWMPSAEALWDSLLTRGKLVFGIADDDSHHFLPEGADNPDLTRPGRGWVMVRADTLSADAIVRSLARGDYYSSTGVTLRAYRADSREIAIEIAPSGDRRYVTEFIGRGGRVLASATGLRARYAIAGGEGYVRARVTDSGGRKAWMQPVMVRP